MTTGRAYSHFSLFSFFRFHFFYFLYSLLKQWAMVISYGWIKYLCDCGVGKQQGDGRGNSCRRVKMQLPLLSRAIDQISCLPQEFMITKARSRKWTKYFVYRIRTVENDPMIFFLLIIITNCKLGLGNSIENSIAQQNTSKYKSFILNNRINNSSELTFNKHEIFFFQSREVIRVCVYYFKFRVKAKQWQCNIETVILAKMGLGI